MFDFNLCITAQLSEDIDHQSSESRLHIAWYGFQHVDQTISYQLAVGTRQGADDVDPFNDVGTFSKLVTNLVLEPYKVVKRIVNMLICVRGYIKR